MSRAVVEDATAGTTGPVAGGHRWSPPAVLAALVVVAAVAAAVALATGATVVALVVALGLAVVGTPRRWGLLTRLVVVALGLMVALFAVGTVAALAGIGLSAGAVAVTLLVVGLVAALGRRSAVGAGAGAADPFVPARPGDVWVLLAALVTAYLAVPRFWADTPGTLVNRLSVGGDNANHVNLVIGVLEGRGYLFGRQVEGLLPGMEAYPPGVAFATGYLTWMVEGGSRVPLLTEVVRDAALLFAGLLVLVVLVGSLLARELLLAAVAPAGRPGSSAVPSSSGGPSGVPSSRVVALVTAPVVAIVLGLTALGPVGVLAQYGFQTQVVATLATLAGVWALVGGDHRHLPGPRLVAGAAMVFLVCQSWVLLAPGLAVAVAAHVLVTRFRAPWWAWAATAALAVGALVPVLNGPADAGSHVNVVGAVFPLPVAAVVPLLLVAVAGYAVRWPVPAARAGYGYLTAALAGAGTLAALVAAYQYATAGVLAYYFYKSVYLVATLAAVATGVVFGVLLLQRRWVPVLVVGAAALIAWWPTAHRVHAYLVVKEPGPVDPVVIDEALDDYPAGTPEDTDVVASAQCNWYESSQTTSWLGGLLMTWDEDRRTFHAGLETQQEALADVWAYAASDPGRTVVVIADGACPLAEDLDAQAPDNVLVETTG